jgi:hypothetical protein
MPRQKCCEHPTRHANSAYGPKGAVAVSSQLSMFLVSRYDAADDRIRWLCPKCHAFEWKEMMIHQPMEFNDDPSSSDDELMEEDSPNDDGDNNDDELMAEDFSVDGDDNNDDSVNIEFENVNEEDEHSYQMDSGIIAESDKQFNDDENCFITSINESESNAPIYTSLNVIYNCSNLTSIS